MGLNLEILRTLEEARKATTPVNRAPLEVKANRIPVAEANLNLKIKEISTMLSVEKKEGEETRKPQPQTTGRNGFEPFVNPQPSEDTLFVNGYNGNFAQRMELNRERIERVLKIAHLDGQVFLTTLSPSRQRSIEANPDGSTTAKKRLSVGEKIDDSQDKIDPPYRTVPIKEGWRIEINDGKIMEDLNEKKLTGEKRQKTFTKKFSQLLNTSLFECIWKEKMTDVKDEHFRRKFLHFVLNPVTGLFAWAPKLFQLDLSSIVGFTLTCFAANALYNLLRLYMPRKFDAPWEYLMPPVEIDKVARSAFFLAFKGRTLVKEVKQETK